MIGLIIGLVIYGLGGALVVISGVAALLNRPIHNVVFVGGLVILISGSFMTALSLSQMLVAK